MRMIKRRIGTVALVTTALLSLSFKDANANKIDASVSNEILQEANNTKYFTTNIFQASDAEVILKNYFNLKNALVHDNSNKAKDLGMTLSKSLNSFDASNFSTKEQMEIKEIANNAQKHAKKISESEIKDQRKHFKALSKEMTAMVAITGTTTKIYQQFCPMYDGGTAWLSTKEEIRNPYYGSQMLKCGKIEREIN